MRPVGVMFAAAVGILVALPGATASPGGALDPTFGTGGKVVTDLGGNDVILSAALQGDGKAVVGGIVQDPATGIIRAAIGRYDQSGKLDAAFGGGGLVIGAPSSEIVGIAVQSDGKVVAAGDSAGPSGTLDLTVTRYNSDGTLDSGFGTGGIVQADFGTPTPTSDYGGPVVIATDGKITVAGVTRPAGPLNFNFAIARFTADGHLDPGFGSGGRIVTDFGQNDTPSALDLSPDGKTVVAGFSHPGSTVVDEKTVLARYNGDGSPDASFDGDGMLVGGPGSPRGLVVQSDGKLVVSGFGTVGASAVGGLFRYDTSGQLDPSFGTGGYTPALGLAQTVAEDPRGRLLVGGNGGVGGNELAVARFSADGRPDASFGQGGQVSTRLGDYDIATTVMVAGDGKITAAGSTYSAGADNWALARFLPTYCVVPNVRGLPLPAAKRKLVAGNCSVGRVRAIASRKVKKKRVVSQKPKAGTQLPEESAVSLVVSRGRPRKR